MPRLLPLLAVLLVAASSARAQVEVIPLAAPDAFSTPGRATRMPPELWRGASADMARTVVPLLAARPLSPATAALARELLATGAPGPEGVAGDEALAGARAEALVALGEVAAAARILDRAPALDRSPVLARAAAEVALLTGEAPRACAIANSLASEREQTYWLRLRAFCQAEAGQAAQAQLTFDLAQAQARDAVFGRLMGARLSGAAPGAASLRNGLDLALSRALDLDLTAATPAPAVAAALSEPPAAPVFEVSAIDAATGGLAASLRTGDPPPGAVSALIAAAAEADAKARPRMQAAALLIAALSAELAPADRFRIAGFALGEGKAPLGRSLAMSAAGQGRRPGEAALLALWTSAEAGSAGPSLGDRVRIVRALAAVGLDVDARAFALEGLAALK